LREGLRDHEGEDLALKLMADHETGDSDEGTDVGESTAELRDLLNRMLVEQIKIQQTEAISASKEDPSALNRYRELQIRRLQLESALLKTE
jgi:DNA primase